VKPYRSGSNIVEITERTSWKAPKSFFSKGAALFTILGGRALVRIGKYSFEAIKGDVVALPKDVEMELIALHGSLALRRS
jgi:gentisate 1,2-dioxygenase